jgi:hypothetical protein
MSDESLDESDKRDILRTMREIAYQIGIVSGREITPKVRRHLLAAHGQVEKAIRSHQP